MVARRVEGLRLERAADEILAVKLATGEAHALNQSAAAVFELCDGQTSKARDGSCGSTPHRPPRR